MHAIWKEKQKQTEQEAVHQEVKGLDVNRLQILGSRETKEGLQDFPFEAYIYSRTGDGEIEPMGQTGSLTVVVFVFVFLSQIMKS